jgi:hypothetical protein
MLEPFFFKQLLYNHWQYITLCFIQPLTVYHTLLYTATDSISHLTLYSHWQYSTFWYAVIAWNLRISLKMWLYSQFFLSISLQTLHVYMFEVHNCIYTFHSYMFITCLHPPLYLESGYQYLSSISTPVICIIVSSDGRINECSDVSRLL